MHSIFNIESLYDTIWYDRTV